MKNFKKLSGIIASAVIIFSTLLGSQSAMAGSYSSSVNLPVLHSRGYVYVARVPVPNTVREGQTIKNVSWNWNVQGWPRGLQVQLCQASDRCIDVSRVRRSSTRMFHGFLAKQPFYFELKLSPSGPTPVAGQVGHITVDW
jgi:flagellar protein FlhE